MGKQVESLKKIRLLGICASPRRGNSYFLLEQALSSVKECFGNGLEIDVYEFKKKTFAPCYGCYACKKKEGECKIKDDFQELRDKWIRSQAILYSMPVYHMSIPGQLKCFIERLGCSQGFYYKELYREGMSWKIPRFLKAVGVIVQGAHLYGGQEKALQTMIDHILLMRCVPVAADLNESYTGVLGWTAGKTEPRAYELLFSEGDKDARLTIKAARTLGIRVVETANILTQGAKQSRTILEKEPLYIYKLKEDVSG